MNTPSQPQEPTLSPEQIREAVMSRLEKYRDRNLLERFALFMGMAQLLELALKGLLHRLYGVQLEKMERWSLGMVAANMRERGLREDFTTLLGSLVTYRNYIAHEMLANEFLLRELTQGQETRLESRQLDHGIYELEQLFYLYEQTDEHGGWGASAA